MIICLSLSSSKVRYYIIRSFYRSLFWQSSSVCLSLCSKRSDRIFDSSFWMRILFYRLRMMTWRSIQRLFIIRKGYKQQNQQQKDMDDLDFFQEVAKQLEEGQWSRLDLLDGSQQAYREQPSLASLSNMSVSGEFLKRKPLNSRGRMSENVFYSTQVIPNLSEAQPRTICLDLQLNRLEKTLGHRKNSSVKPHFKRQKTLLKRLPLNNKQNSGTREGFVKDNMSITSQFLQEIKKADEELYEIYLSLYRFQEREKEVNEQIKQKIQEQDKDSQLKTIQLKQLKRDLQKINAKMEQQQKNQKHTQTNIFKNSIRQYLPVFQSQ